VTEVRKWTTPTIRSWLCSFIRRQKLHYAVAHLRCCWRSDPNLYHTCSAHRVS